MKFALFLVLILNIFDAVLTSFVVSNAIAVEMNPLMGAVLELGIVPFIIIKLGIIVLSLMVLWKCRHVKLARIGTNICLFVYLMLACYFGYALSGCGT
jgi:hypothetical protein